VERDARGVQVKVEQHKKTQASRGSYQLNVHRRAEENQYGEVFVKGKRLDQQNLRCWQRP
jgi:hypothetical protein